MGHHHHGSFGGILGGVVGAKDGKTREMFCLHLRKIPAFLYSIDARKVKPEAAFKIRLYQEECDEVLWKYWTEGMAVNRASKFVSEDTLSIEKGDYIRLLEAENRLLRGGPKRARYRTPMTDETIAKAKELREKGNSYRDIARELDIYPGSAYHAVNYKIKEREDQKADAKYCLLQPKS